MIRSLFGRLLLSHMAVILVSTVLMGLSMSFFIRSYVVINKQSDLITKGSSAVALLETEFAAGRLPGDDMIRRLNELAGATVWLARLDGTVLVGQPPNRWYRQYPQAPEELLALFSGDAQSWVKINGTDPDRSMVIALPVRAAKTPTALFLFAPVFGVNKAAQAMEVLIGYALLVGAAVAVLLGLLMSRSLTRPIGDIGRAARQFAQGDFACRTSVIGDDEIGKLGQVFNSMARSLAHMEQNRREFLANVTHEIKTPIAAIQALAEALADGMVAEVKQQQRYCATIISQTRHMNRLVQDLLDLAQLEAGELKLVRESVNLDTYITDGLDPFSPLLAEKAIRFDVHCEKPDILVWADPLRLGQVFSNLISNAIRHSPPQPCITIRIRRQDGFALISVFNQGEGIPAAEQENIWQRFYRADQSRSRSGGGTGLGLAITRELVWAMGGEISVESGDGGTTFFFTLPLAKAE